jgi:3-oxoacyl-[acyl-carrier-protein] synthase-3
VLDVQPTATPAPEQARLARTAGVAGLGTALPATIVDNDEVAARLDIEGSWIEKRTGIRSRRRLADGERLSDLATEAAAAALQDAGIEARQLDLILAATFTADEHTPGVAPLVAAGLGCNAAAMDVNAACVGFLSAVELATAAIESRRADHVLVVAAEAVSRFLDLDDRRTAGLFGDGAGAAVLSEGAGTIGPIVLRSAGEHAPLIVADRDEDLIRMQGHETFILATQSLCEATISACSAAGVGLDDIDIFVFHQANRRILTTVAERLGIDEARVIDAIADIGNTSAASIPLTLEHARREGRLRRGDTVLLGAMGAGFVYGAGVMTW